MRELSFDNFYTLLHYITVFIWNDMDDSKVTFKKDALMELFMAAETKAPTGSSSPKKASDKPKLVELLEPQRAKSISIMLGRLRMKVDDIAQMVKNLDTRLTEDQIASLKSNVPTADEIGIVENYDGDKSLLGPPENYVLAISQVKMLQQHIDFLDLRQSFDELIGDVETPLGILTEGFKELKESKKLKELLELILGIGNFLNGGSNRGGAYGFKFDFFKKMLDIRTNKPGYTLLNYIADNFDAHALSDELSHLPKMLTVDFDTAKQNFQKLDGTFNKLTNQMAKAEQLVPDGYMLQPQFLQFKSLHQEQLEKPPGQIQKIDDDYKALVKAYGEDPAKIKLSDFVEVFNNLVKALVAADDANKKRVIEEKKAEERAKKMAERQKKSPAGASGPAKVVPGVDVNEEGDAERGVIDELMSKLQKGGVQLRKPSLVRPPGMGPPMPGMGAPPGQMSELQRKMAERLAKQNKQ